MALAHAIEVFGARGNMEAVSDLEKVLQKHGDVNGEKEIDLASPEQLVQRESKAWGKDIFLPPQALFDVWKGLVRRGVTIFEPHAIVDGDQTYWILIEGTPRPNFNNGQQLYEKDPWAEVLKVLRPDKGKKKIPQYEITTKWGEGEHSSETVEKVEIPQESRFGITRTELYGTVLPAIAVGFLNGSNVKPRTPTMNEYQMIGKLFHPEWAQVDTREFLHDHVNKGSMSHHLVSVDSSAGGFANVSIEWDEFRSEKIGFRVVIPFPAKAA